MIVIGLTGGIGSGKSTVCQLFEEFGATIIDTDQLARDVVQPGSEGLSAIEAHFGAGILHHDGSLNRAMLRQRIFEKPQERAWLEAELHPRIRRATLKQIERCSTPLCVVAIPLLTEQLTQGQSYDFLNRIIVVDCDPEIQLQRASARDGNPEQIQQIMQSQASREARLKIADDVILNNKKPEALRPQVEQIIRSLND